MPAAFVLDTGSDVRLPRADLVSLARSGTVHVGAFSVQLDVAPGGDLLVTVYPQGNVSVASQLTLLAVGKPVAILGGAIDLDLLPP